MTMPSTVEESVSIDHSKIRRRVRSTISCTECHRRKQKCNRLCPCNNCTRRGKPSLCLYNGSEPEPVEAPEPMASDAFLANVEQEYTDPIAAVHPDVMPQKDYSLFFKDLGYTSSNYNTSVILKKLQDSQRQNDHTASSSPVVSNHESSRELDQKYRELVRQLPSKRCTDILVKTYFEEVNWQYYVIDELKFQRQMNAWRQVSYADLRKGVWELDAEMRAFPALLFQIFSQALIYQPDAGGEWLESLKYAANMTFADVATEFSEAGIAIISMLGKSNLVISMIQAQLLRASFLKSSGKVIEAWHIVGSAIRDAQEIGLHLEKAQAGEMSSATSLSETQILSDNEEARKVFLILHIWDVHMAVVLGRPISTHVQPEAYAVSATQLENSLPTPFTVILVGYLAAFQYFPTVRKIEINGAKLEDYSTVEQVHSTVQQNLESLPSWCRFHDPRQDFDQNPACLWLPAARTTLASLMYTVLLALHRPYIFSVPKSRTEAIKAAITMLQAQSRIFEIARARQCNTFVTVYASFDAIVLIAAIFCIYPKENGEYLEEACRCIEWGIGMLEDTGHRYRVAKSAHEVVLGLYRRLNRCLASAASGTSGLVSSGPAPPNMQLGDSAHPIINPGSDLPSNAFFSNSMDVPTGLVSNINPGDLMPPLPTHELLHQDLGIMNFAGTTSSFQTEAQTTNSVTDGWHFPDSYSSDSFWQFLGSREP